MKYFRNRPDVTSPPPDSEPTEKKEAAPRQMSLEPIPDPPNFDQNSESQNGNTESINQAADQSIITEQPSNVEPSPAIVSAQPPAVSEPTQPELNLKQPDVVETQPRASVDESEVSTAEIHQPKTLLEQAQAISKKQTGNEESVTTKNGELLSIITNCCENIYHKKVYFSYLKVVSTIFLLVCFVCLKERTCETRTKFFYMTSKAIFVLEIIKF